VINVVDLIHPKYNSVATLNRDIFGPSKTFLKQDANCWVNNHQNRKVTRMQSRILIGGACDRAASVSQAESTLKPQEYCL
jgi:hypothetical protein